MPENRPVSLKSISPTSSMAIKWAWNGIMPYKMSKFNHCVSLNNNHSSIDICKLIQYSSANLFFKRKLQNVSWSLEGTKEYKMSEHTLISQK